MAALSDYLESGLLHHVFRGEIFNKPSGIAIALCSGVPLDSNTGVNVEKGGTLPELPTGIDGNSTGYSRINLGDPTDNGDGYWSFSTEDHAAGSGVIKNVNNDATFIFDTALLDWGAVSGIAIVDSGEYGVGNLLMHAPLDSPRIIYTGDSVKFDSSTLQISFK